MSTPSTTLVESQVAAPPRADAGGACGVFAHLLCCPVCRGTLAEESDPPALRCAEDHRFDVVGGVPVLLEPGECRRLGIDYDRAGQMRSEYRPGLAGRLKKQVKRAIGSSLYLEKGPRTRAVMRELEDEFWLEVGSGTKVSRPNHVSLDIGNFAGVDVVGSASRLPFADGSFAMVRSLAVLEHVREPERMIAEMLRVVRPGGYVYTEVPFLQHFHAYPNDFQRYTREGLRQAFSGCEVVEEGVCIGPSSALTAMAGDWLELWTFTDKRWINDAVRSVALTLLWPLKFLDHVLVKNPRAHEVASGISLLCRKPG